MDVCFCLLTDLDPLERLAATGYLYPGPPVLNDVLKWNTFDPLNHDISLPSYGGLGICFFFFFFFFVYPVGREVEAASLYRSVAFLNRGSGYSIILPLPREKRTWFVGGRHIVRLSATAI